MQTAEEVPAKCIMVNVEKEIRGVKSTEGLLTSFFTSFTLDVCIFSKLICVFGATVRVITKEIQNQKPKRPCRSQQTYKYIFSFAFSFKHKKQHI